MRALLFALVLLPFLGGASVACTVPYTFVPHTVIDPNQVNANFGAVNNCIDNVSVVTTVSTNTALRAASVASYPTGLWRCGFYAAGDAPCLFYVGSSSACSLSAGNGDNGSQVKSFDNGCWIASLPAELDPRIWGADPTGANDSTAAWVQMFLSIGPGQTITITDRKYLLGNLTVPANTTIKGNLGYGDPFILANTGITVSPYTWGSQIQSIAGTTISVGNGVKFQYLLMIHQGMTLPVTDNTQATALLATYADTAITGDSVSFESDHVVYLGYNKAIEITNTGGNGISNKTRFEYNLVDCNSGPFITNSGDTSLVLNNHIFPFLTISVSGVSSANTQRPGSGIFLNNQDTSTKIENNLVFGYANGISGTDVSEITVASNHIENLGSGSADSGIGISGQYLNINNNFVIGYPHGITYGLSNAFSSANGFSKVTGNSVISASTWGYDLSAGYGITSNNFCQDCSNSAFRAESSATGGIVHDNWITGTVVTPMDIGTGNYDIRGNQGYDPGPAAVVSAPVSGGTYTAGNTPETIYMAAGGGTITSVVIGGGEALAVAPIAANTMVTFHLDPQSQLVPTYTGFLSMKKKPQN